MNLDELLGKYQRNSELRVVRIMRTFTLLTISSLVIAYIVILVVIVTQEHPVISSSEEPLDSFSIPGNYKKRKRKSKRKRKKFFIN